VFLIYFSDFGFMVQIHRLPILQLALRCATLIAAMRYLMVLGTRKVRVQVKKSGDGEMAIKREVE
jgi:hypothetical protein